MIHRLKFLTNLKPEVKLSFSFRQSDDQDYSSIPFYFIVTVSACKVLSFILRNLKILPNPLHLITRLL